MSSVRNLVLQIRAQDEATRTLANFSRTFQGAAGAAANSAIKMQLLGVAMLGIGAKISTVFRASIDQAAEFEATMRNANVVLHLAEGGAEDAAKAFAKIPEVQREALGTVQGMAASIQRLTTVFPQSANDIGKALYFVGSAGFKAGEAFDIMVASMVTAVGGMSNAEATSRGLVVALRSFGLGAKDVTRVADVLFSTVEFGIPEFQELVDNLGKWVPAASAFVQSTTDMNERAKESIQVFTDFSAAFVQMTRAGMGADQAATALNRIAIAFAKPSKGLQAAIAQIGEKSAEAAIKNEGLVGTMLHLRAVFGDNITTVAKLFPDIRELRGALALLQNGGDALSDVWTLMNDKLSQGTAFRAFQEQSKSLKFQIDLLQNAFATLGIQLGETFAPTVIQMTSAMSGLSQRLIAMHPQTKTAIGAMLGLGLIFLGFNGVLKATQGLLLAYRAAQLVSAEMHAKAAQRLTAEVDARIRAVTAMEAMKQKVVSETEAYSLLSEAIERAAVATGTLVAKSEQATLRMAAEAQAARRLKEAELSMKRPSAAVMAETGILTLHGFPGAIGPGGGANMATFQGRALRELEQQATLLAQRGFISQQMSKMPAGTNLTPFLNSIASIDAKLASLDQALINTALSIAPVVEAFNLAAIEFKAYPAIFSAVNEQAGMLFSQFASGKISVQQMNLALDEFLASTRMVVAKGMRPGNLTELVADQARLRQTPPVPATNALFTRMKESFAKVGPQIGSALVSSFNKSLTGLFTGQMLQALIPNRFGQIAGSTVTGGFLGNAAGGLAQGVTGALGIANSFTKALPGIGSAVGALTSLGAALWSAHKNSDKAAISMADFSKAVGDLHQQTGISESAIRKLADIFGITPASFASSADETKRALTLQVQSMQSLQTSFGVSTDQLIEMIRRTSAEVDQSAKNFHHVTTEEVSDAVATMTRMQQFIRSFITDASNSIKALPRLTADTFQKQRKELTPDKMFSFAQHQGKFFRQWKMGVDQALDVIQKRFKERSPAIIEMLGDLFRPENAAGLEDFLKMSGDRQKQYVRNLQDAKQAVENVATALDAGLNALASTRFRGGKDEIHQLGLLFKQWAAQIDNGTKNIKQFSNGIDQFVAKGASAKDVAKSIVSADLKPGVLDQVIQSIGNKKFRIKLQAEIAMEQLSGAKTGIDSAAAELSDLFFRAWETAWGADAAQWGTNFLDTVGNVLKIKDVSINLTKDIETTVHDAALGAKLKAPAKEIVKQLLTGVAQELASGSTTRTYQRALDKLVKGLLGGGGFSKEARKEIHLLFTDPGRSIEGLTSMLANKTNGDLVVSIVTAVRRARTALDSNKQNVVPFKGNLDPLVFQLNSLKQQLHDNPMIIPTIIAPPGTPNLPDYHAPAVPGNPGNGPAITGSRSVTAMGGLFGPHGIYGMGSVLRSPVNALLGEGGPEVVIPLSDSHKRRRYDLLKRSGLLSEILGGGAMRYLATGDIFDDDASPDDSVSAKHKSSKKKSSSTTHHKSEAEKTLDRITTELKKSVDSLINAMIQLRDSIRSSAISSLKLFPEAKADGPLKYNPVTHLLERENAVVTKGGILSQARSNSHMIRSWMNVVKKLRKVLPRDVFKYLAEQGQLSPDNLDNLKALSSFNPNEASEFTRLTRSTLRDIDRTSSFAARSALLPASVSARDFKTGQTITIQVDARGAVFSNDKDWRTLAKKIGPYLAKELAKINKSSAGNFFDG